jgi:hypothetical protein
MILVVYSLYLFMLNHPEGRNKQLSKHKSYEHENHLNNFKFKNRLLYFKDLFYVPNGPL